MINNKELINLLNLQEEGNKVIFNEMNQRFKLLEQKINEQDIKIKQILSSLANIKGSF